MDSCSNDDTLATQPDLDSCSNDDTLATQPDLDSCSNDDTLATQPDLDSCSNDDTLATQPISLAKKLSSLLTKSSTRPHQEADTWTKEIALFIATALKIRITAVR